MFDIGISELGVIGVVALVVLGPERLPRVARTVGNLLGRAQRYMADIKSEVNRQMELDELRNMKASVEDSMRQIQASVAENVGQVQDEFDAAWREATSGLRGGDAETPSSEPQPYLADAPSARRTRRQPPAVPVWYRRQSRLRRRHVLSTAARAARLPRRG